MKRPRWPAGSASDLKGWNEVINRESWQALQGLALDLLGVVVALAVIMVGSVLWRIAVVRYVTDAGRRRLLLTARSVVITVAIALVLIFHFTSEMAALVRPRSALPRRASPSRSRM